MCQGKFFLWTKLLASLLLAKYLILVTATLVALKQFAEFVKAVQIYYLNKTSIDILVDLVCFSVLGLYLLIYQRHLLSLDTVIVLAHECVYQPRYPFQWIIARILVIFFFQKNLLLRVKLHFTNILGIFFIFLREILVSEKSFNLKLRFIKTKLMSHCNFA